MCETKVCKTCNVEKLLSEFHLAKKNKQGVKTSCKICTNKKYEPKPLTQTIFLEKGTRICTVCREEKDFSNFYKSPKERSGVGQKCKSCTTKIRKEFALIEKTVSVSEKVCGKCKIEQCVSEFVKDSSRKDGLASTCQTCVKEYRSKNKELFRNLKREYTKNNKEHILQYARNYTSERLQTDGLFKFASNIRGCVLQSFKSTKNHKKSRTVEILGCPIFEFKNYIESQFEHWMTFENHGNCETIDYRCSWDLDHCVPSSYAKTEDEIILLNHWSNFQPLCSRKNRVDKKANFYPCTNLELGITFWEDRWEYV